MSEVIMPIFETAEERTKFIKDHATYFTLTWRSNLKNHTFQFPDLELTRFYAKKAANTIGKPVLIYSVWRPDDLEFGYDTWIETIHPRKRLRA